ncbi:MAG: hypothetical protein U1G05_09150 [Kiritimatiellia bacterium]
MAGTSTSPGTSSTVSGYDLHDFVTSPAHTSTIPTLDVYNPDLEWSAVLVGRQFLSP